MNTSIEELLRQGIDNRTAGAQVPAGLATRAVRRSELRRKVAALSAVSAVTAAVAVAIAAAARARRRTAARRPSRRCRRSQRPT